MAGYEEEMLIRLVEKYRASKKDSGTNVISRRTGIAPSVLYKKYSRNDGDVEQIERINQAAAKWQDAGYVTFEYKGFSNEIAKIYLVDDRVLEIEEYLESACQYESKRKKQQQALRLIERYGGISPAADRECGRLRETLQKNGVPKNCSQTEDILKALTFIERNQTTLYLREASMLIYGTSKYLEENTLDGVCHLLRVCDNLPCREDELPDEILVNYHILPEKQKLCLKGDITLDMGGRILELGGMKDGIEFFTEDLASLKQIRVHAPEFRTVENKTAYYRCQDPAVSFFYLAGFATRFQRDFLKQVYRDNPDIHYRHFGDLDAGGFYIHENLCRVTGIPFGLYRMSVSELQDPRFHSCLQPLSDRDRKRLESLAGTELYGETARYMLRHNVKLEQEIICYYEKGER